MNLAMDIWPFKAFARGREASGVPITKRLYAWWEGYELPDSDDAAETSPVDEPLEEISIDGEGETRRRKIALCGARSGANWSKFCGDRASPIRVGSTSL